VKAAFEPRIRELCLSFWLSGMRIRGVPELQWYASKSCDFATNKWADISYFDTSSQYRLVCFDCQMGLGNMQCWICHKDMPRILRCTGTSTIGQQILLLCHNNSDTGTQYHLDCLYAKWDRQICSDWSVIMICTQDSPVHQRIQGISSWLIQHIFQSQLG